MILFNTFLGGSDIVLDAKNKKSTFLNHLNLVNIDEKKSRDQSFEKDNEASNNVTNSFLHLPVNSAIEGDKVKESFSPSLDTADLVKEVICFYCIARILLLREKYFSNRVCYQQSC